MKNLNHFKEQIKRKIESASAIERIKFGLDICKRLFPEYVIFKEKVIWGNTQVLLESIGFIERYIDTHDLDLANLDNLIKSVEPVIPDTENFGDWEGSYALNASGSIFELLMYLKDNDYNHIISISTLMTDTIDFKLQQINDKITEDEIDNHPKIIDEFEYQLKQL
jgi:uncharacterized protein YjaG (DUF416 family)